MHHGTRDAGGGTALLPATASPVLPSAGVAGAPDLAELLDVTRELDELQARAVALTARLAATGEAEQVTQIPLELWLSIAGRMSRSDRRTLMAVADVLTDLPRIAAAFGSRVLSWSQVRTIALAVKDLRRELRTLVDDRLAELLADQQTWEPDELVARVDRLVDAILPERLEAAERRAQRGTYLHLQPDLFDAHGTFHGELPTPLLARWADQLDTLATRLEDPDVPVPPAARALLGADSDTVAVSDAVTARRGTALSAWIADPTLACGGGHDGGTPAPLVDLKLTMTLDSLLGRDGTPAELLTRLTGRHLKVSATTARRLMREGGAAVESILLEDTGNVLGVGRRQRLAPDWLRTALTVMQPSGIAPNRHTTPFTADADHLRAWNHLGPTDLDNLGLLARSDHRLKHTTGWTVTALPDGTRRWQHPRADMTVDVPPWTRQPTPPRRDELPSRRTNPRRTLGSDVIPPPDHPPDG